MSATGNGLGRFICQLRHLTITYCRKGGSSVGARQFIAEDLVGFAKQNPQVMIDVVPKPYRHPTLIASYLNGRTTSVSVRNMNASEVGTMVQRVRDVSGFKVRAFPKWVLTKNSSIQGNWTPFTNA